MRALPLAMVALIAQLQAGPARAQGGAPDPGPVRGEAGFQVTPSLAVSEAYDDNLFSSPEARQPDWITRLSPAIDTTYRSQLVWFAARYGLDADAYREHPSLWTFPSRQEAATELIYIASPRWRWAARGGYMETHAPTELTPLTGLDLGRIRADRIDAGGGLTWRFGSRSRSILDYDWTRDSIAGGLQGDTHVGRFLLERRLSARDAGRIGYTLRRFAFANEGTGLFAHVVSLGWTRDLPHRSRLELLAGPRFEERKTGLEADATLRVAVGRGELALAASQVATRVIGLAGSAEAQTVSLILTLVPARFLRLDITPGFYRTRFEDDTATVRRLGFEASFRLAAWLSLDLSQQWSLQQGTLGPRAFVGDIPHNVFMVRVAMAPVERERRPSAETLDEDWAPRLRARQRGRHEPAEEEASEQP